MVKFSKTYFLMIINVGFGGSLTATNRFSVDFIK